MTFRRVAVQLGKEFWFPALAALAWGYLGKGQQELTPVGAVTRFSTAFFFVSWMLAQYFRVSKHVRVDASLSNIQQRIEDIVEKIEKSAYDLMNWSTGGSSFAYMSPIFNGAEFARSVPTLVLSQGQYPVYGLSARVLDLALLTGPGVSLETMMGTALHIGDLAANTGVLDSGSLDVGTPVAGAERRFNVFFSARNGFWTQHMVFRHDGVRWHFATRVERANGEELQLLHEQIMTDFPNPETLGWN